MTEKEKEIISKISVDNYETAPYGGSNPYHYCVKCGISTPQINGNIFNHADSCDFRERMLNKLLKQIRKKPV